MQLKRIPRYAEIAGLIWKHGRGSMFTSEDELFQDCDVSTSDEEGDPEQLASDLEDLGPTFIKLGQLLSSRADLLPESYVKALARLQDDVEPFTFEQVEEIVREELGVRISKAFSEFDREPLAAASLGQVHGARLRDGRSVVVKVQRPDIRSQIVEDLEILAEVAEAVDSRSDYCRQLELPRTVENLRRTLLAELDYRQEAENLRRLSDTIEPYQRLQVPAPIVDYSTSKVLTMEKVEGAKITEISPVALVDMDGEDLIRELFCAYLDQVLVDGVFHADPHPGNLILTPEHKIALIDLGMVARVPQQHREHLLRMIVAISEGHGSEAARTAVALGRPLDDFQDDEFRAKIEDLVSEVSDRSIKPSRVSKLLFELSSVAGRYGLVLPQEFVMLGKTLLHLEEIGLRLAPGFDANEVIRRHAASLVDSQTRESYSPSAILSRLMEVKELVEETPGRLNRFLSRLTDQGLRIDVDALNEALLIEGFQKIANRITSGLILAALIIGAAMLMQVPTDFQLLGYPGLAILLFGAAVAGGFYLLWSIVRDDRSRQKSR